MNEHAFPTNLASMIESILLDPAFDRDDARESRAEAILDLLTRLKVDWQNALDVFFHVLLDGSMKQSWQHVLESTWLALGKIKDFPASMIDYTIAVIYHCVQESDLVDGNLAWSITCTLKRVNYDSDYDPFQDAAVYEMMKHLSEKQGSRL